MLNARKVIWAVVWACFVSAAAHCALAGEGIETDYLFKNTHLIRIRIDIPDAGMNQIEQGYSRPRGRAKATVTEGGTTYSNVLVQLKGRGTFQSVYLRPSLTLHFGNDSDDQRFHGLKKISLNNASQDPTCLQEKFARDLFAEAGVPVARADQAFVTLNGKELGVYVLTEGYDKLFLRRFFKKVDGPFFDGGLFTDIDQELEVNSGSKTNFSGLTRAYRATFEKDDAARYAALDRAIDLDRFIRMIAMETIICHFDGYAMRGTNYRVYHDPESDKLVFMPQGMDRVMGNFRFNLDLPVVPPMVGLAARALISTDRGRALYLQRVEELYRQCFRAEDLVARVRGWDSKIAPEIKEPKTRWGKNIGAISTVPVPSKGEHADDVADFCERIRIRGSLLGAHLQDRAAFAAVTPMPKFGTNSLAIVTNWSPRAAYLKPEAKWEQVVIDGTNYWHLSTSGSYAALGTRLRLPAGQYFMSGTVRAASTGESVPRIMLRHFFMPFVREVQPVEARRVNCNFRIAAGAAPEEIDVLWEVRGPGEVWFQPDSFRLRKQEP